MAEDGDGPETFELTLTGGGLNLSKTVGADVASQIAALVVGGSTKPPGMSKRRSGRGGSSDTKTKTKGGDGRKRRRTSPAIVSDLSLRPSGKRPFAEFAEEKMPRTHPERQAVALYWLRHEADIGGVTVDHVNTCYQGAKWKRPGNLENSLQQTANRKGWLDTSDSEDIALTVAGEDFVTHELPRDEK